MSIVDQLASRQGVLGAEPNKAVARRCLDDPRLLAELRPHLQSKDRRLQGDVAEVFTEVARLRPDLVVPYADDLLALLITRNNRALWEMLAGLAIIAGQVADKVYAYRERLLPLAKTSSVIVVDGAIRTLAQVAAANSTYAQAIVPELLTLLHTCIPRDLPRYGEYIQPAVLAHPELRAEMQAILESRLSEGNASAQARVRRLLKSL